MLRRADISSTAATEALARPYPPTESCAEAHCGVERVQPAILPVRPLESPRFPAAVSAAPVREKFPGGSAGPDMGLRFLKFLKVNDAVEHGLQAFPRFGAEPFGCKIGHEFAIRSHGRLRSFHGRIVMLSESGH